MVGDPVVWKRKGKAETAIKVWKGRPAHPRGCSPGQLAAVLLAGRCPSNIRVSVQASLPIHAAVLRASSQQCCSLAVARRISAFLCRQACPSTRLFSGLIAQKTEAVA